MPDQVSAEEQTARARAVAERARALWSDYARRFVGVRVEILAERSRGGIIEGVTRHYLRARVAGDRARVGGFVHAEVERLGDGWLEAARQD